MRIRPIQPDEAAWVKQVMEHRWGGEPVVIRNSRKYPHKLPALVCLSDDNEKIGLLTYEFRESECEIITLDALQKGNGIGTLLIEKLFELCKENNCGRVCLITTNDNLDAIRFYQKRGFRYASVFLGAVIQSRKIKPTIPEIGDYGIPIKDEIEFEYILT